MFQVLQHNTYYTEGLQKRVLLYEIKLESYIIDKNWAGCGYRVRNPLELNFYNFLFWFESRNCTFEIVVENILNDNSIQAQLFAEDACLYVLKYEVQIVTGGMTVDNVQSGKAVLDYFRDEILLVLVRFLF